MKIRVMLGMSGGTDSSVSAMLLKEQAFEVVGITFGIFGNNEEMNSLKSEAESLCTKLNIEHYFIDLREDFSNSIIDYFINSYKKGVTPFPCAVCNTYFKFYNLEKYADKLKCPLISTGHYVKTGSFNNFKYIYQGKDKEKDQSFFLWNLSQKILNRLILPLGNLDKTEVRQIALERKFVEISEKKDSFGICFIQGNDYRRFLQSRGVQCAEGNFVDIKGKIIGRHKGIVNYTIGQRRGLGLNLNNPVFVSEIRAAKNEIVLSEFNELYKCTIYIKNYFFVDKNEVLSTKILNVKVRYRLQNTPCKIKFLDEVRAKIELLEPLAMIAKGQTTVFYDENRVVGGGFIEFAE